MRDVRLPPTKLSKARASAIQIALALRASRLPASQHESGLIRSTADGCAQYQHKANAEALADLLGLTDSVDRDAFLRAANAQ